MRRSQISLAESVAVVFVFFLLVVAGFIFYSKIEKRDIIKEREEFQELGTIEISQLISFLPEIQCSRDNVPTYNCFDILKLKGLISSAKRNRLHYYDIFRNSNITIKQIYPEGDSSWNIYENVRNWTRKLSTQVPVSLFNATGDPLQNIDPYFAFGVMTIDVFV